MNARQENSQLLTKTKLLKRLNPYVMKDGFQSLRMDDIAKYMDVSRATMYKYFSSKEEVVEGIVGLYEDYIKELVLQPAGRDDLAIGERFLKLFEQSILLVGNMTDVFQKDLQAAYPDLHERLMEALHGRDQEAAAFYREGIDSGYFNPVNEKLIVLQDNLLLREIVDAKYLLLNGVSLEQILHDYFSFKKTLLFKPEHMAAIDDARIEPVIDYIVKKFNRML
ncbi:TetR/AcrR family transcriptional regulator [Paenibacillus humicola]|uniref:TetR/AcrR family transcriptional regulator n=1 Tax=Paenibacillus humicola TaxID=3110540 RepID=UPI00237A15F6|nr:TetR/AcrR family transcriptional regulator [Paenibacillus humicola]